MMYRRLLTAGLWVACLWLTTHCQPTTPMTENLQQPLLDSLLLNNNGVVGQVARQASKYQVQVRYAQINRNENNQPHFTYYQYRANGQQYFYPASTVKLPVALMALEKLDQLSIPGLDRNSTMLTDSAWAGQTPAHTDATAATGLPSIAHYINKLFVVSDNDAYNRLYEFVGQKGIWEMQQQKGLAGARLVHRLSVGLSPEQNSYTNPIRFYNGNQLVYEQPQAHHALAIKSSNPILLGKGYIQNSQLVNAPKDFTQMNALSLEAMQQALQYVLFPQSAPPGKGWQLPTADRQFVYRALSALPRELTHPQYDTAHYYDSYVKFFMFGDSQAPMPGHIRIFNKVGMAYGYLIDNAYVVDFENKVEFMLSAVIYVNENEIFNDDQYEYDSLGFPFLAELGRLIYAYELKRPRRHVPDLSRFEPYR